MSCKNVVGHEAAIARLRALIRLRRVAHAYVFAGPSGVGKKLVAVEFGRAILCGCEEPCETCDTCRRTARGAHPDLKTVACEEDKREIAIAQIRELIRELSFASERPRAVIVDEAERMNEESQNAFLKTLEEAPERTVIVLVTSSPSSLLPTIRSRCQTILFHALPDAQVAKFVEGRDARLAAALAEGSPGRARELVEDLRDWNPEEMLAKIASGDLNATIEGLGKIRDAGKARARAQRMLRLAALALRDALRASAGAPLPERLSTADWGGDLDLLAQRLEAVLDHELMIDRNASVPLVVENALLRMG